MGGGLRTNEKFKVCNKTKINTLSGHAFGDRPNPESFIQFRGFGGYTDE